MSFKVHFKMNENLYLRDPEQSELGKKILTNAVLIIHSAGFEDFTFKKLAAEIKTGEASIYRYFENKHRLLLYLTTWYWTWLEFRVSFHTNNITDPWEKLKKVIDLLVITKDDDFTSDTLDIHILHEIIITEATKVYLTKHVLEDNKQQLFKPYKDLCSTIADIIKENNKNYQFCRSLASTLIEMAHFQAYFMKNLPTLTDFPREGSRQNVVDYLDDLVIGALKKKK